MNPGASPLRFYEGQELLARVDIYEGADDHSPGGYLCHRGDVLRVVGFSDSKEYPIRVQHLNRTRIDDNFKIAPHEVEPRLIQERKPLITNQIELFDVPLSPDEVNRLIDRVLQD